MMGAAGVIKVAHPAVTNGLNLVYGGSGSYPGFDRFGRIVDQHRTHNADGIGTNEISGITESGPAWVDPAYDAAGNTTTMPNRPSATNSAACVCDLPCLPRACVQART